MTTTAATEPSSTTFTERRNEPRSLRPCERGASGPMRTALRRALDLERGPQKTAWVAHPHRFVAPACARRGLASEYRVTETPDAQVFYVITDAGRAVIA